MFKNYLTTALRNLWRSKASTLINVLGLTLGIATSLILFLIVRYHTSFDTNHSKRDRIYRVVGQSYGNQSRFYSTGVAPALPDAFRTDFPEVEALIFSSYRAGGLVTVPQRDGDLRKFAVERGITYVQPEYFSIFDRGVLIGDPVKGLDEPNEAVISAQSAITYFGKEDAVGEVFQYDGHEFKVTAIIDNVPTNTDLPFDVLLSFVTIKKEKDEVGWNGIWSDEHCYFLLKEGVDIAELERRLPDFVTKHYGAENPDQVSYELQPLSAIHFDDRYSNYNYATVTWPMITAFSVIGIFLIITACINFINLVTAEAIKRSKEVGIRKTLGSSRVQLILQFLGESTLVTVVSVVLAIAVATVALGFLNSFLDLTLTLNLLDPAILVFLVGITFFVSLLSGLYPAFVVSGFRPVFAIKNQMNNRHSSGFLLRRVLVVIQFIISQWLIICTIVLVAQMSYFRQQNLGFRQDAIVTFPIPENERLGFSDGTSKMRALREDVAKIPGVELASLSSRPPSSGSVQSTDFGIEGKEERFGTQVKTIDGHYVALYDLKVVAGSNVADLDTAQGYLVNEKLVQLVGFANSEEIIGKTMEVNKKKLPVVGVVKDFHTMSLHEEVDATVLFNRARTYQTLSLKLNPQNRQETIREVQKRWEQAYPEHIFSYQFYDEEIAEFYQSEERTSTMLTVFTSIAIFIGCLGLFGLATFMANRKTKEIGVRKVLGASVESIILSFSKEYVILILVGFAFAAPLGWYVMSHWLNDFAYKIEIGPMIFATCLAASMLLALVTVGYRSFRAAVANPAQALRSE
ncbi:MAG: ABC transporter permease [Cyclobacteriaceae bacterium]|nr:ABC transporter permease [Cyclobacteriaceae bacterium]